MEKIGLRDILVYLFTGFPRPYIKYSKSLPGPTSSLIIGYRLQLSYYIGIQPSRKKEKVRGQERERYISVLSETESETKPLVNWIQSVPRINLTLRLCPVTFGIISPLPLTHPFLYQVQFSSKRHFQAFTPFFTLDEVHIFFRSPRPHLFRVPLLPYSVSTSHPSWNIKEEWI